jgi:hypothetical protein
LSRRSVGDIGIVRRDQQFNGFRQVWSEHPDGTFDGAYTVYWGKGEMRCMHGHYVNGAQHGLWTHWTREGTVSRQLVFDRDGLVEERTSGPWADDPMLPPERIE